MDFKNMETDALEARKAELAELAQDVENRSLEELTATADEMTAINAELEARRNAEAAQSFYFQQFHSKRQSTNPIEELSSEYEA